MQILKKTYWQFFNSGTGYRFDPNKKAQKLDGSQSTLAAIHKDLVREWNRPDVYILNDHGELVEV
jgi:hypothetical protein